MVTGHRFPCNSNVHQRVHIHKVILTHSCSLVFLDLSTPLLWSSRAPLPACHAGPLPQAGEWLGMVEKRGASKRDSSNMPTYRQASLKVHSLEPVWNCQGSAKTPAGRCWQKQVHRDLTWTLIRAGTNQLFGLPDLQSKALHLMCRGPAAIWGRGITIQQPEVANDPQVPSCETRCNLPSVHKCCPSCWRCHWGSGIPQTCCQGKKSCQPNHPP